jgi:hypothetical protein
MLLHVCNTFISGNCLAHRVIAKLATNCWFCVYLCSVQEFAFKQSPHNQIIAVKLKYCEYYCVSLYFTVSTNRTKLSPPSGVLLCLEIKAACFFQSVPVGLTVRHE